nr:alpha-hydroxy-acid oxidizing protein [Kitasatospora sp. SID7827]
MGADPPDPARRPGSRPLGHGPRPYSAASTPLEDVARAAPAGRRWFQSAWPGDEKPARSLLGGARRADRTAVVPRGDCHVAGRRPANSATASPPSPAPTARVWAATSPTALSRTRRPGRHPRRRPGRGGPGRTGLPARRRRGRPRPSLIPPPYEGSECERLRAPGRPESRSGERRIVPAAPSDSGCRFPAFRDRAAIERGPEIFLPGERGRNSFRRPTDRPVGPGRGADGNHPAHDTGHRSRRREPPSPRHSKPSATGTGSSPPPTATRTNGWSAWPARSTRSAPRTCSPWGSTPGGPPWTWARAPAR